MKRKKRGRVPESERCTRCGSRKGKPCVNYRKKRKAPCSVTIGCQRCLAQVGLCRHKWRRLSQPSLFPAGHPVYDGPTVALRQGSHVAWLRRER